MDNRKISIAEMIERYNKLYLPAVTDILDAEGHTNQWLGREIKPLRQEMKIGQSHVRNTELTDEMITFLKHLGVNHVEGWVTDGHGPIGASGAPYSVGYMRALISHAYEQAGISIKGPGSRRPA